MPFIESVDLRQRRAKIHDEVIKPMIALSNKEDRDFTPVESRKFDEANEEVDRLKARIDRIESAEARDREFKEKVERDGTRGGVSATATATAAPTTVLRDVNTGREHPLLRNTESVLHGRPGDPLGYGGMDGRADAERVDAGSVLRAMLTGPKNDAERRALSEGTDSTGGYAVPEVLSAEILDFSRAKSTVFQAGARTLVIDQQTDTLNVASVDTDPTAGWHAENASLAASDPTFGVRTFAPRVLYALVKGSRELAEDSPGFNTALTAAFAGSLAAELDRVMLRGSGTAPEPKGIRTTTDVNAASMGTNGAAITSYDELIDALQLIEEDNFDGNPAAVIMAPRTWGTIEKFKDTTNQPLQRPPSLANTNMLVSSNVSIAETQGTASDASTIFLGNFEQVVVGLRTSLRVELLKEAYAANYQYGWLAAMRLDVQVMRPKGLGMVVGIIP